MKTLENVLSTIVIIALICMVLFAFTSCSAGKYGCGTGANPRMTWNRMVDRINRP